MSISRGAGAFRPRCSRSLRAQRRRSSAVRAEIRTMLLPWGVGLRTSSSSSKDSSTKLALVPPAPKELTVARRGLSSTGCHGSTSRCTRNLEFSQSMLRFAGSQWRVGTKVWCCICSTHFTTPTAPAAASRCPMLDFTEPIAQLPGTMSGPKARSSPSISIGSPKAVPVPWASTYEIEAGSTLAASKARATTALCARGPGTVYPLVRPPWLTAVDRITARTGSSSRQAADMDFSTRATAHSPGRSRRPLRRRLGTCRRRTRTCSATGRHTWQDATRGSLHR